MVAVGCTGRWIGSASAADCRCWLTGSLAGWLAGWLAAPAGAHTASPLLPPPGTEGCLCLCRPAGWRSPGQSRCRSWLAEPRPRPAQGARRGDGVGGWVGRCSDEGQASRQEAPCALLGDVCTERKTESRATSKPLSASPASCQPSSPPASQPAHRAQGFVHGAKPARPQLPVAAVGALQDLDLCRQAGRQAGGRAGRGRGGVSSCIRAACWLAATAAGGCRRAHARTGVGAHTRGFDFPV